MNKHFPIIVCIFLYQTALFAQLLSPEELAKETYYETWDDYDSYGDYKWEPSKPLPEKVIRLDWRRDYPSKGLTEPLAIFKNLQALHLDNLFNQIKLPKEVFEFEQLQELSIRYDTLENPIANFNRIKHLKRLGLYLHRSFDDNSSDLNFDISELPNLEAIALASFGVISDLDFDRLSQLPKLKELYLCDSWFQSFPSRAGAFQQLEKLFITIPLRGQLPKTLPKFEYLKELHIDGYYLTDEKIEVLGSLLKLEKLSIESAKMDNFPESIKKLQLLKTFELIGTSCNNWQNWVNQLSKLPNLEKITLPLYTGKADYSALKKVQHITIWEDYYAPDLLGVGYIGFWRQHNLDLEQLIPNLQTFPHLETIEVLSDDLNVLMDLLAALETFNDVPTSPLFRKKKVYLDWFRQKLNPSSLVRLEEATQKLKNKEDDFPLMSRVHLLKHIHSAQNTERYGLALIKEAEKENLEDAIAQDIEAVAYYYIGYQYQKEKSWKKAIDYFQKCHDIRIKRGDNLKYSLLHFVDLYMEKGDWTNFEKYTDLIIKWENNLKGYYIFYNKSFPKLFQEKNYAKAEYFFEIMFHSTAYYNSSWEWDQFNFFYRDLYKSVYNQGTLEEQHYWINRWAEMANKHIDAEQARKTLRWVINDLFRQGNYTEAAYYAQSLIEFEEEQYESDKLHYVLEKLQDALKLKCYMLMSGNELVAVIDAYIELLEFQQKYAPTLQEQTLKGLNELVSKIVYKKVSKEQRAATLERLKKWVKAEKNPPVQKWLNDNIAFIKKYLD